MKLNVKYLFDNIPELNSKSDDSGYDLRACINSPLIIEPHGKATIPTGIAVEVEDETGYFFSADVSIELQVRPRSGHTMRGLVAQFGTVDRGYRGEISVTVINHSNKECEIQPFERIAQLVVCPIFKPIVVPVKKLSETNRGTNGFGSSGKF